MDRNSMEEVLGYPPNKEMRLKIIMEANSEGLTMAEVASRYALPELIIKNEEGLLQTDEGLFTEDQYEALHPYKKIVVIQ